MGLFGRSRVSLDDHLEEYAIENGYDYIEVPYTELGNVKNFLNAKL